MKKEKYCAQPITNIPNLLDTTDPKFKDGTLIGDDDLHDGFSARGTVRYGEEVDADDL
ncbi:MAG: hypothetical protein ACRCW2_04005 [Cellulosilyticaceae bacterium]